MGGLKPLACANLPYNITTPVLTALIEAGCFQAITVMIQREVALRICAAPGSGDYGAFSVYCQYHTAPELLFDVPPECFIPAPKVTSSVIRLVPPARAGGGEGREAVLPPGARGLCPAAEDPAQRPVLRLRKPAYQGCSAGRDCCLRPARRRAGGAAGGFRNLPPWPTRWHSGQRTSGLFDWKLLAAAGSRRGGCQ